MELFRTIVKEDERLYLIANEKGKAATVEKKIDGWVHPRLVPHWTPFATLSHRLRPKYGRIPARSADGCRRG